MRLPVALGALCLVVSVSGVTLCEGSEWAATAGPTGARALVFATAPNGDILAGLPDGLARRPLGSAVWQPAGLEGVRVVSLLTASDGRVYAGGSRPHGVHRSTDGGFSWQGFSEGLDDLSLSVGSIVETVGGVLLAGTVDGLFAYSEFDGSWLRHGLDSTITGLVANPEGDLFVITQNRLMRSEDGGVNWIVVDIPGTPQLLAVTVGDNGLVLVLVEPYLVSDCSAFLSTDFGGSFSCADAGLESGGAARAVVLPGGELLVGGYSAGWGSATGGVWLSTDLGASWQRAGLNEADVVALSYLPGSGLWLSTEASIYHADLDLSWQRNEGGLVQTTVMTLISTDSGLAAGGMDFGVQRLSGAGAAWEHLGLENQRITCGLWTRNDGLLVCGDRWLFRYLALDQWEIFGLFGDGLNRLVELPDGTLCGSFLWGIECSSPGTGHHCVEFFEGFWPTALLATGDGSLLAAAQPHVGGQQSRLYQSADGGCSWIETGTSETPVRALADGGAGVVYAAAVDGKVFRSEDGGLSWELRGQLGNLSTTLTVSRRGQVYAGTLSGVSVSFDGGVSWLGFGQGLDGVEVTELAVQRDLLYAGTSGRGVYRRSIGPELEPGEPWTAVD